MNLKDFITKRPFIYHLTDSANVKGIIDEKSILSTSSIVRLNKYPAGQTFLTTRRSQHTVILEKNKEYHIRDQRPISMVVLQRSLERGCSTGDFIEYLNSHVFFWPTPERLWKHYNRYKDEKPIILRLKSDEVFKLNTPRFSRINSGATRCNSYLGGNAPERGLSTFLESKDYDLSIGSVAEVTFYQRCILPNVIEVCNTPDGNFKSIKI